MVDLSQLSDAELELIASGGSSTPDLSSVSDAELEAIASSSRNQDWNIGDSLKNFGSGVIEGATGLAGLIGDLSPFQSPAQRFQTQLINRANGGEGGLFSGSENLSKTIEPMLAEKDPQYRYARTLGNFALPMPGGGGLAKQAITSATAALGAQSAEDLTGDTKIAPLVGAIAGGSAPSAMGSIWDMGRRALKGATPQEIKGSAALAFKDLTGLQPDDISSAIQKAPQDDLAKFMTTAELTDNAGAAQLEKTLTQSGEGAQLLNNRTMRREAERGKILDLMSNVPAVNQEGLGSALINQASDIKNKLNTEAKNVWAKVPRQVEIPIGDQQGAIRKIISSKQAGLPPSSKVNTLIGQFFPENDQGFVRSSLTSGALQDIRSDSLALLRDANITPYETRLLTELQGSIDDAMSKGLKGEDYNIWRTANDATRTAKQTFSRETSGGSLTNEFLSPKNALKSAIKGDSKSIEQLKAAIGNDPALIEETKRGFLDLIPRDANGNLTAAKMSNFIKGNEGSIKALLGEDHLSDMQRVLADIKSENKVGLQAFRSSKGNSVTAQRGTVGGAVSDIIAGSVIPGVGPAAQIADAIKKAANIKDTSAVEKLLLEASLDPKMALELAQAPTNTRILNVLEGLKGLFVDTAKTGGIAASKELSRSESNISADPIREKLGRALQSEQQARDSLLDDSQGSSAQLPTMDQGRLNVGKGIRDSSLKAKPISTANQDQFSGLLGLEGDSPESSLFSLKNASLFDMGGRMDAPQAEVRGVEDMAKTPEFEAKAAQVADNLGIEAKDLLKVIGFETGGTYSPTKKNGAGSGATGLIQFMPETAKELLLTDTKEEAMQVLNSMTDVEQLDLVEKYLKRYKGKINSLDDLYMAVLYPKAIDKHADYPLFKEGTTAYKQNKGLDIDRDGIVTKVEAASKVRNYGEA